MTELSVIGCGNMGGALLKGLSKTGTYILTACDLDPEAREAVSAYCSRTTADPAVAAEADIVVLAVKPGVVETVLGQLNLSPDQTLVSIAAGLPMDIIKEYTDAAVVRVMPNLAAETETMAAAVSGESIPAKSERSLMTPGSTLKSTNNRWISRPRSTGAAQRSSSTC